ncbi:Peroxisomal ATPase PEX6 [[Candida] zeylanoides]
MPSALPMPATPCAPVGCDVDFVSDPGVFEADGLRLSPALHRRLFGGDEGACFVSLRLLGAPDFFDAATLHRVTGVAAGQDGLVATLVNHTNLLKFNDQITVSRATVQAVAWGDILALDKVFVSVPPSAYRILQSRGAADVREAFARFLEPSSGVVNTGDCVRAVNATVELCEPLPQGRVDRATTAIVLIERQESPETGEAGEAGEEEADIDFASYLDPAAPGGAARALEACPTPARFEPPRQWAKEDPDSFAYINSGDLTSLGFGVFSGDLVRASVASASVVVRLFTVVEPNTTFAPGAIYLSPLLLVNLGIAAAGAQVSLAPVRDCNQPLGGVLPTATSVTIARVASQITLDKTYQQSLFAQLKAHFNDAHRCVRQGDVIPVVIDTVMAKVMFDVSEAGAAAPVVPVGDPDAVAWFRVGEVEAAAPTAAPSSGQFVVDPAKTRIISSGVEYAPLPPNSFAQWARYLELPQPFAFAAVSQRRPGLFGYAAELRKVLHTTVSASRPLRTSVLLSSMVRGLGKTAAVRDSALALGVNLIELDCFDMIHPGAELKTLGVMRGKIDKLIGDAPSGDAAWHVLYLKHIENLCVKANDNEQGASAVSSLSLKVAQLLQQYLSEHANLVLVMSCNDVDKLDEGVRSMVKFEIEFGVPSEGERLEILRHLLGEAGLAAGPAAGAGASTGAAAWRLRPDVTLSALALQSAGLTPRDLISICANARRAATKRIAQLSQASGISYQALVAFGSGGAVVMTPQDFAAAINEARNQFSDSIGAPRIPNVKWADIGGLDVVKDEILDTIDMPMKHPELFNNGLKKRSGILFYGPPGTGKTLLAKAIATNFSLNFFSVKGPELLNMYIGESEANVRRVFQRARDAKPCVIFFDELDSVAPKRGNQGDSGGVMDRIVSQLLAELDGMSGGGDGDGVFVVGATNRPDLLDEALLRPGRFDKMLYLGISDTNEKQAKILEALTRKFTLGESVDLAAIARKCSFTFTGADFYALCSDSMLNAMTRTAGAVDAKIKRYNDARETPVSTRWWFDNVATEEDIKVMVEMEDFEKAQSELSPSVSAEELEHYLRVRRNFEGGKEAAGGGANGSANASAAFLAKVEELVGEPVASVDDSHS